jgi:hypothetical protein
MRTREARKGSFCILKSYRLYTTGTLCQSADSTESVQDLAQAVSEFAVTECNGDDDDEPSADINRQAIWKLREWAYRCEGESRRWDHYCQWPSRVTTGYLDLLDVGDDVALLIFIYWAGTSEVSEAGSLVSL